MPDLCPGRLAALGGDGGCVPSSPRGSCRATSAIKRPDRQTSDRSLLRRYLSAYLGTVLAECGWRFVTGPGEPVQLERGAPAIAERVHVREVISIAHRRRACRRGLSIQASAWDVPPSMQLAVTPERQPRFVAAAVPVLRIERGAEVDLETTPAPPVAPGVLRPVLWPGRARGHDQPAVQPPARRQPDRPDSCDGLQRAPAVCAQSLSRKSLDEKTGAATLTVLHPPYAELIERCNV